MNSSNQTSQGGIEPLESNLLRIAYQGKYLLLIGAIIGVGLGYLNKVRTPLEYESTAQVLIDSKTTAPIPVDGPGQQRETTDIIEHAAVIQSPTLIDRAIREHKFDALPFAKGISSLRAAIQEGLTIVPLEGSDSILEISFVATDDESSCKVINGLITTFQDFYGEMDHNVGQEMFDLVVKANSVLADQLKEKQRKYDDFRQNSPLVARGDGSLNLHQERMLRIETQRSDLELNINSLKIEIAAIESAFAKGMDVNAIRRLAEQMSGGSGTGHSGEQSHAEMANVRLLPLLLELESLEERYGSDHPDVLAMRKQVSLIRKFEPSSDLNGQTEQMRFAELEESDVRAHLAARKALLDAKNDQLISFNLLFEKEQKSARALRQYQVKDSALKSDLQRTKTLFESVLSRLDEVNLTKDHGGFNIQVLAYAEPGLDVSASLVENMVRGSVLGIFAAFGIAYLTIGRDRRFTDLKQVSSTLGVPIMGAIPQFESKVFDGMEESIAASVHAYHRPKSLIAEGYRGIRTGLYFSLQDQKRVVQITSPLPGEGKSTLTANLAASIAASGKSVLIIDADMRRPRQHVLFGEHPVSPDLGLAKVLAGEAGLRTAKFQTSVPNLSLLPCGEVPDNPGELLVSKKINRVIDEASREFDFVLIDSPPMLAVSDSSSIAARAEGVLLTFNLEKTARQAVTRSCEILQKVDCEVLGVVVNQVEKKRQGKFGRMYYYEKYGYGYADGYSYGGYGDREESSTRISERGEQTKPKLASTPRRRSRERHMTNMK